MAYVIPSTQNWKTQNETSTTKSKEKDPKILRSIIFLEFFRVLCLCWLGMSPQTSTAAKRDAEQELSKHMEKNTTSDETLVLENNSNQCPEHVQHPGCYHNVTEFLQSHLLGNAVLNTMRYPHMTEDCFSAQELPTDFFSFFLST